MIDFGGTGHVQNGIRPGIVFQNNVGNAYSPTIIAIPLTSVLKKINLPSHVVILASDTGLKHDSMAICEGPECVPKEKIGFFITKLNQDYMKKIAIASMLANAAVAFLSINELLQTWEHSVRLNREKTRSA